MSAQDLRLIATEMRDAACPAVGAGLFMDEYDEYGFPEQFRQRVGFAMDRWENGVVDLLQATREMAAIVEEMSDLEAAGELLRERKKYSA